jgi:cystathionine beta-lyase
MRYDFDKVIDRKNTNSIKWDHVKSVFGDEDILPMWVADMDFSAPPPVIEALKRRAELGIYGYPKRPRAYYEAIINWMKKRHGWEVEKEWLTYSPGVVAGINLLILALTQPGEKVIIQPPVYYPFYFCIRNNGRQISENPLKLLDGRYHMDFDDLAKRADERTRLMILCSPHNPVGRVWEREDLLEVGEFCFHNDIILISDEIHSDLVYPGHKHIPTAMISDELAQNTITCMAPSKTFNLAGLKSSVIIIPNQAHRRDFNNMLNNIGVGMDNIFGLVALESAYRYGEDWLEELIGYLSQNLDFLIEFVEEKIPKVEVIRPEATYLVWLDFRALGLDGKGLIELMTKKAKVWLDDGPIFGPGGEGFQRINIACPRATLEKGLKRIEGAVKSILP